MESSNYSATDLLQKYLDGTITEPESKVLFEWLKENTVDRNPAMEALLEKVYAQSFTEQPALNAAASQRILDRLLKATDHKEVEIPVRRISLLQRPWVRYAAAVVLLLGLAGGLRFYMHQPKKAAPLASRNAFTGGNRALLKLANGEEIVLDSAHGSIVHTGNLAVNNDKGKLDYEGKADVAEYHTLSTPRGGQYQLQLPDGSKVWLNAASSITYPTAFTGNSRKVKISGEVYFEVARNKEKPFVVDISDKTSVEVLGTSFNVNAYTDEQQIYTTLLEGSVSMIRREQRVILKPGQQAVISRQAMEVKQNANIDMVMAWKNGSFQFDHTKLDEVLRKMSRWYDVDIVYKQGIPDIYFSGEIKRDLPLSDALEVLSRMGVHYSIEERKLIIMP
jgi:transmembrane sensor